MPAKKSETQTTDYKALRVELDTILDDLQNGEIDIEQALAHYQRGQAIVKQLQEFLKAAENKVTKLKVQLSGDKAK